MLFKRSITGFIVFCAFANTVIAQNFTRKDSLQGGFAFERICFDVQHYAIDLKVETDKNFISGSNTISFKMLQESNTIQLDLFENMQVDSIVFNDKKIDFKREFGAVFLIFPTTLKVTDNLLKVQFYYSGYPIIAQNPPWDGGFVISKDKNKNPWFGVAVQGKGASLWLPIKDSQSDEPDLGATINVAVPKGLKNISNGRFKGSVDLRNGYTRWDWEIKNPINSYNLTLNIGDYVLISDKYNDLDLEYYVLRGNEEKAHTQFAQVKSMLNCFEDKFGPYPFREDSYKLIETNYLGMEHQSAVSYGNKYKNGYLGRDISGTGIGLLFDFIIIHESAHEWFGNSITSRDIADMWIHEAFTTYAESVYVECLYGKEKAIEYIYGLRKNITNSNPIIGKYGVNHKGSNDMYYKGALLLHTLRNAIDDDEKWWKLLKKFSLKNRHKIIETEDVISFFSEELNWNLQPFFNQYLNYTTLPTLETKQNGNKLSYRWKTEVENFQLPIHFHANSKKVKIQPTNEWQTITVNSKQPIKFQPHLFYINFQNP